MIKIAVIIVTFNGQKWIEKCLKSVFDSNQRIKVIIVDNASTDETLSIVKKFPQVEIISRNENLGFGKANNLAIKKALIDGFEQFFLLNQDTFIFPKTIDNLSAQLSKNQNFGIVSPLHYSANETDLDLNFEKYFNNKTQTNNDLSEIPFVNAAAWMVSKKCFEKVGLFEPSFNHYGEDRNFCDRLKFHGFKIGITSNSKIVHDRVIIRNYKKDVLQSKFLILSSLINCNFVFVKSIFTAQRQVFGLPKFFRKHYGVLRALEMFFLLQLYFFKQIYNLQQLKSIKQKSVLGTNGY
jgi:GT2 family glycosyltransferase